MNCADYSAPSLSLSPKGPVGTVYSHSQTYTGTELNSAALPSIQYSADASGSYEVNGYSGLPSQLDYRITQALKSAVAEKKETENLPVVAEESRPVKPEIVEVMPRGNPEQDNLMLLFQNHMQEQGHGSLVPEDGKNLHQKILTFTEEETMVIKRKTRKPIVTKTASD